LKKKKERNNNVLLQTSKKYASLQRKQKNLNKKNLIDKIHKKLNLSVDRSTISKLLKEKIRNLNNWHLYSNIKRLINFFFFGLIVPISFVRVCMEHDYNKFESQFVSVTKEVVTRDVIIKGGLMYRQITSLRTKICTTLCIVLY
jgi:hypothetical protein